MSKSGFASEKVMKNYLDALLVDNEQPAAPARAKAAQAAQAAEETLQPVARLLEKVSVIERPARPATPPPVQTAPVQAPPVQSPPVQKRNVPNTVIAPPSIDTALPTIEDLARGTHKHIEVHPEKAYRQGRFQALFFEVAGLTLAVPLTELGGIHNMRKLNSIVGKPDWFMGVMVQREEKLNIVNTAKWVMPEKYNNELEINIEYQYIIMLDNSPWGLACEKLVNTVVLEHDDVKWRESAGRRPWLAGLIKERMCALLDVSALIELLERGQGSQHRN